MRVQHFPWKERRPHWLHGRAWLGDWTFEWVLGYAKVGASFELDDCDREATFSFGLWFFAIYVTKHLRYFKPRKHRQFGFSFHDGAFWLTIWGDPTAWDSKSPWWMHTRWFDVKRFLLGKALFGIRTLVDEYESIIPLPEGAYRCTIKKELHIWSRPRWFIKKEVFWTVNLSNGIPYEGKGENAWDCGEDGLHSISISCETAEQAIGKVVAEVLSTRQRRTGSYQHRDLKFQYVGDPGER